MWQVFSPFIVKGSAARRGLAALSLLALISWPALAEQAPSDAKRWVSGAYSFSAELGGFRIVSVSGKGTRSDPVVIAQELTSASPVILVIRIVRPIRPFDYSGNYANGFMHVRIEALNNSALPWVEFEFELQ
jgi:hypothetical protein